MTPKRICTTLMKLHRKLEALSIEDRQKLLGNKYASLTAIREAVVTIHKQHRKQIQIQEPI